MSDEQEHAPQATLNALLASGFPLQTAVADLVRRLPNCELLKEEFPWRSEAGDTHFLDIVAQKLTFTLSIECKKTQKETLTFLLPHSRREDVLDMRVLYLNQIQDPTRRMEVFCADWPFFPKSIESAFCVVSTSATGKDHRLLERDAQILIRGTDAFARQFKKGFRVGPLTESDRPIIPVLVTNAKLFAVAYDPSTISLETGELPMPKPAAVRSIPWARFRKTFVAAEADVGTRTVVVVNTQHLANWIRKFEVAGPAPKAESRVHFQ